MDHEISSPLFSAIIYAANRAGGIHGTIQPDLIGQQVSHGCVRMLNKDVEELYDIVPIGAKVLITE